MTSVPARILPLNPVIACRGGQVMSCKPFSHATLRFCLTAAVVIVASSATMVLAQGRSSPVLNSIEVQMLVKNDQPADNAKLSAHFAALAEQYDLDARRHENMARAFIASPTRRTPANTAADHCKRLAQLNTESAKILRELAAFHEARAAGKTASIPKGAGPFHSGAGALTPADDELTALAAKAATPADHKALQEYFANTAKRYRADRAQHLTMAQAYSGTRIAQAADHCNRLANLARDEAAEAEAAAKAHETHLKK